jgi:hypothetical protein
VAPLTSSLCPTLRARSARRNLAEAHVLDGMWLGGWLEGCMRYTTRTCGPASQCVKLYAYAHEARTPRPHTHSCTLENLIVPEIKTNKQTYVRTSYVALRKRKGRGSQHVSCGPFTRIKSNDMYVQCPRSYKQHCASLLSLWRARAGHVQQRLLRTLWLPLGIDREVCIHDMHAMYIAASL